MNFLDGASGNDSPARNAALERIGNWFGDVREGHG